MTFSRIWVRGLGVRLQRNSNNDPSVCRPSVQEILVDSGCTWSRYRDHPVEKKTGKSILQRKGRHLECIWKQGTGQKDARSTPAEKSQRGTVRELMHVCLCLWVVDVGKFGPDVSPIYTPASSNHATTRGEGLALL